MPGQDWMKELAAFMQGGALVICLGNEFRGDDGVGLVVARALAEGGIPVIDAGRNLLSVLPDIEAQAPRRLLFVDAAELGMTPGSIVLVGEERIVESGMSTHENNLPLALAYLRSNLPGCECRFLAIQTQTVEMTESIKLSGPVEGAVRMIVEVFKR